MFTINHPKRNEKAEHNRPNRYPLNIAVSPLK